jgi:hypothetical protein
MTKLFCRTIFRAGWHRQVQPANFLGALTIAGLAALYLATSGASQTKVAPGRPSARPQDSATRVQVWFHPNMGSEDLLRLFSSPEAWPTVRDRVDVFGLSYTALRDTNPAARKKLGPNTWEAIQKADVVKKLAAWGKALDLTAQPIQSYRQSPQKLPPALENAQHQAALTIEAIDNVRAQGGQVQYVTMDEPLRFSGPDQNNYALADTVKAVKAYMTAIHDKYPDIQIGEYMPYPRYSAVQIERWIDLLAAAGTAPAFEHLDVNYQFLLQPRQGAGRARLAAELPALAAFCRQRQIPFGVVYTTTGTIGSSRQFFVQTRQSIQLAQSVMRVPPDHVIFQSWAEDAAGQKLHPVNLPETGNFSLTYLVKTVLGL